MNIRDLQYIILVDKYQHFSKAASVANVSQPALSMQINKLEEELDILIFERNNKKIITTDIGKKIIAEAKEILSKIDYIKEIAKYSANQLSGAVRLGAFPTLAPYLFPKILPQLVSKLPNLQFYLTEEKTNNLINDLAVGKLDIAFLALPINNDLFTCQKLFRDKFYLAVAENNPVAKQVTLAKQDLDFSKMLLLEEGHCLRDQALEFCPLVNNNLSANFSGSSLETIRQMVAINIGFTFIPEIALDQNPKIKYLAFSDINPYRDIAICYRKTSVKLELLSQIADLIKLLIK
ncbi:MAG: LysR substrate-binding domain-containing protein [Rickettsiales bacterium]